MMLLLPESFQEQQLPPHQQEATTNSVRNLFYLLFLGGNGFCCARHIPLYYACDRGTIVLRVLLTMTRTNILVKAAKLYGDYGGI